MTDVILTDEEALIQIGTIPTKIWEQLSDVDSKALGMAIKALEKQIPKKPTPIDYKKYTDVVNNAISLKGGFWCPNCKCVVKSGTYCNLCGQRLDWSDEE